MISSSDYWHQVLKGVEPTRFPDLTGRSALAQTDLHGFHVVKESIRLQDIPQNTDFATAWLAALFKIVSLYSGETDLTVDYLCQQPECDQSLARDLVRPVRVTIDSQVSNHEILTHLARRLGKSKQFGPPQEALVRDELGLGEINLSDILFLHHTPSGPESASVVQLYKRYNFIVEISSLDAQSLIPTTVHVRSRIMLLEDTPHVFAGLRESFHSFRNLPSHAFVSWQSCSAELVKSISNQECKPLPTPCGGLVHSPFEKHAVLRPDDIALDFLHQNQIRTQWSYSTLNSIANLIADILLRKYRVKVEDSVPICVSKSPIFYACLLGVLKAGASFTPFVGLPTERQKFMLSELESRVILHTSDQDMSWCGDVGLFDVSSIVDFNGTAPSLRPVKEISNLSSSNLCYQMYTSGTTGRPKAVSLEHRNAVQTAYAARELVPWEPQSRILQQAGVTFDMCYFEIFFAWNTGICLCSASNTMIYNSLSEVVNTLEVSLLGSTPSIALTLNPESVPQIKWVYCIGEMLPQSLVNSWGSRLVNSYGPTEAAQMVTLFPVQKEVKAAVIGGPFRNTTFMVLRKDSLDVIPMLGAGELCIGGCQIARGYFKNEEKTRQSFITAEGQRLYRSGDLVRMLGNGSFEFLGRVDDQVKVRGQRVELGEVDKALMASHPAIKRASTQIFQVRESARSQLVAFLASFGSIDSHSQQEIRKAVQEYLSRILPGYMIPTLFVFIPQIPLSATGKIDKRALHQLLRQSEQTDMSRVITSSTQLTETQHVLRELYSAVSGLPQQDIGVDTSIYQLGLDSISAIQIAHGLKERGYKAQASTVMKNPSIVRLAPILDDEKSLASGEEDDDRQLFDFQAFDQKHRPIILEQLSLYSDGVKRIRPASPLQSGMLAQSTYSSGTLYFNHLTYCLPEEFEFKRFCEAWKAVVSKHEILRSGFTFLDNVNYSVAMITYEVDVVPVPIQREEAGNSENWGSDFAANAIKQIHLPPWNIVVSASQNKFLLSAHHSLYDAQVLDIILHDLDMAYDNKTLQPSSSFDRHLSVLLHEAHSDQEERSQFWKGQGLKAVNSKFPTLHPFTGISDETKSAVAMSDCSLSVLERECRIAGVTLQAAAQLTWAFLLSAWTGESHITFGTVLSGRITPNSNEISFPMITTMPTVVNIQTALRDSLQTMMDFNADVQIHQFAPLKRIESWMGFTGQSLFNTIFTYQKRANSWAASPSQFVFHKNELAIDYPVSAELEPIDGRLQFSIYYKANYMENEQAKLIVQQYHFLLANVIQRRESMIRPHISIARNDLFSVVPAREVQLLSQYTLLHNAIESQAEENPDKIAIEFITSLEDLNIERLSWSFQQLNEEGNKVAHLLRTHKIKQGSIVVMCFEKCPEAAFTMLGILKAGCAFLALDPSAPFDRQKFIVKDSQASILLTKGSMADRFGSILEIPVVDFRAEDMNRYSSEPVVLLRPIDRNDMSYCLYTSGTTGTPKGCMITHENVVQVLLCFQKLYRYSEASRWLQFASYHFDVSVMEHFWSWSVGMTVVKADRDLLLRDLSTAISRLQISHIDLTPSLARLLDPKDVPTLANGVFVTGGEMLRADIIERWGNSGAIHNAYGPTEATIGVTMYRHVPKNGRSSNIGWPFPVVGLLVVDPSNPTNPVLRGAVGELCISGKLVAKGYLHRDELTKQRFIHLGSQRYYRTGDLVRLLSNGSVEFIGRTDDQVKLRGQRLEVGEINTVMRDSHYAIDDVSTLVLKHPNQQKEQLVSFVVVHGAKHEDPNLSLYIDDAYTDLPTNLRSVCIEKLPIYMIPTHILLVNRMPLSANNKIDGKQLKTLYEKTPMSVLQRLTNRNPSSRLSTAKAEDEAKIWQVLNKDLGLNGSEILRHTTFLELGLDSVSLINFAKSLRCVGFAKATPLLVMNNLTVSKLAGTLGAERLQTPDGSIKEASRKMSAQHHRYRSILSTALAVLPDAIEAIAPCTPLQAGIISRSLESKKRLYFTSFTFDINDAVDLDCLHHACQRVCNQVQILRTSLLPTDDGYMQVIMRQRPLPWSENAINDDSYISKTLETAHKRWQDLNKDAISQPLEILITKSPTTTLLTLHIFHALYDGNSLALLLEAINCEYDPDLKPHYGPSFIEALPFGPLRERHGARDFWQKHLSALSIIPQLKIDPFVLDGAFADTSVSHLITSIHGFEQLRRRLNVTSQAILQACWTALLQDALQRPVAIGLVVSGRSVELVDADKVIGPLFNTIPMLLKLHSQDTWRDVILRCHEFNTAALEYQHTPLRDIQKWVRKDMSQPSLFETLFTFQKERQVTQRQGLLSQLRIEAFEADYPLAIDIEQRLDNSFLVTLACQATISNESFSRQLLDKLEQTIESAIKDVDQPLSHTIKLQRLLVEQCQSFDIADEKWNGDNDLLHSSGNSMRTVQGLPSWSQTTHQVCNTIAALAEVEPDEITLKTSIFEVGLDSIDAVKLSARLQKVTNGRISVSHIMRLLTLEKIAAAIEEQETHANISIPRSNLCSLQEISKRLKTAVQTSGLDIQDVERILPCTPLQESMIAEMLNSHFMRYLNFDVLRLNENINVEKLKSAWDTVIKKVPVLRSRFVDVADATIDCTFAQLVMNTSCSTQTFYETDADFSSIIRKLREDVMDSFSEKPALRLCTVQRAGSAKPSHMILGLPHAMYDGVSLGLIHDLVAQAYNGNIGDVASTETALMRILGSAGTPSYNYWQHQLCCVTPTSIPARTTEHGSHRSQRDTSISLTRIQQFCKQNGVTISALSQTAWSIVLAHHAHKLDICYAQVLSGRTDEFTKDVVFPTMNTVIFRTIIHGTRSEMVQYIQQSMASNAEHQHFPLRKALSLVSKKGATEIFNTIFIFQHSAMQRSSPRTNLYESVDSVSDVEYPICVEAEISDEKLIWRALCKKSHFNQQDIEHLLSQLEHVLDEIVQHPNKSVIQYVSEQVKLCGLDSFTEQVGDLIDDNSIRGWTDLPENFSVIEEEIVKAVAETAKLDTRDIRKQSNIFSLGLDSISVIKVSSILRKQGIRVTVNEILATGSIEKIAEAAGKNQPRTEVANGIIPRLKCLRDQPQVVGGLPTDSDVGQPLMDSRLDLDNIYHIMPATPGQVFLLSRWQNQDVYYSTLDFWISNCDSIGAIRSAWASLVAQNPILRTVFAATSHPDHPIVQAVLRQVKTRCVEIPSQSQLDKEVNRAHAKYEGGLGPPCALYIQRAEDDQFHLAFKMAHALYDGFSLAMLTYRLRDLLNKPNSPSTFESQSFSRYIDDAISNPTRRSFWTDYLADLRMSESCEAMNSNDSNSATTVHVVIPNVFTDLRSLDSISCAKQLSIQPMLLATYASIHARTRQRVTQAPSNKNDIVIGIYLANRNMEEAEEILAPTLGFVPLRIKQPFDRGVCDIALGIQSDLRKIAQEGQGQVGLWEVAEWTGQEIHPDVWVNILRPPPSQTQRPESSGRHKTASAVEVISGEKSENVEEEITIIRNDESVPHGLLLKDNPVRHFYDYPMMDFEITIKDDSLDVGILAPKSMFDIDGAKTIIADFEKELSRIVKTG